MLLITIAKLLLALASFQEPAPLMWTGERGLASSPTEKEAPVYAEALRKELASLVTRTDVQRDYRAQLDKLDQLRGAACWSNAYPGKADLLSEIAALRADWLEKLGRHADAVYAAQHALVMPAEKDSAPFDRFSWTASNGSLADLVKQIDALPRTIELRKRFPSSGPATKGGDAIEEVVRSTLDHGDPRTLKDFGTRCVPALQKAILEGPDEDKHPDGTQDPLSVLLAIDRTSAESLILSTVGKRSPAWTLRVLRALGTSGVTGGSWVNSTDPLQPPRFDDPLTLQMIDVLAAQPLSALTFFALIAPLVRNDVISPAIRTYLLGHTQASDPQIVQVLCDMLDGQRCGPNKRELYEAYFDSASPDLRQRSARALRFYSVGPATLRAIEHSDPNVRTQALVALLRHYVRPYTYWGPPTTPVERAVPRTPEIEAALLRLAHDSEPTVRAQLVEALQEAREEPPAAVLEALLSDPDAQVRQRAAYNWTFNPELQARVLQRLASDKDVTVLRAVGLALNSLASGSESSRGVFELCLPALARWLTNPEVNLEPDPNSGPSTPLRFSLQTPKAARVAFDACVHGPRQQQLAPFLLEVVRWTRTDPKVPSIYDVLDAPAIAELFALDCVVARREQMDSIQRSVSSFVTSGELDAEPFLALARDEGRPRNVRLRALKVGGVKGGPPAKELVLSFLRSPESEEQLDLLLNAALAWADLKENLAELCGDPKIPDGIALYVAGNARAFNTSGFDEATTRACLSRWARLDERWKAKDVNVFYFLDPRLDSAVLEVWRANFRDPRFSLTLVNAMWKFPVDESVPLLTDAVRADWMSGSSEQAYVRTSAIGALTTRLDDLGADALLKAIASAPDEETRKKCFDGLEQIRKYQDEKQSWQKRKGGEAAREQAIADLLPMLSDKDANIRAAAARSLATLQAAEHLPKLVALLKDKDASVREAAQKALDALNGAGAKKP